MTSFLCIVLLITYLVFFHPLKIRKWFLILLFSGLILFALTMVFTQSEVVSGSKLQVFIEDVLQKNMTFSGRTVIWMYSLYMISNSFISGYGWVDKDWALENIHGVITHNIELQILLQGGIILGIIFLFLLYTAIRKQKNKIYVGCIDDLFPDVTDGVLPLPNDTVYVIDCIFIKLFFPL